MTTARAETTRLVDLLRREHHAMAEFLVALSAFDRERRWEELGYPSLFDFLRRELHLSAGAAQNRKTAARLIQRFPEVEGALRRGELCLSSINQVARVLTLENAAAVLPRFFGKSARDAEFVAASIRPVEHPPRREFLVTPARENPRLEAPSEVTERAFHASETTSAAAAPSAGSVPGRCAATPDQPGASPDRPRIKPLDAERARVNMTVSRRLLDKLAAARDALSHSHPRASEETILELGLDLIIDRHRKRRGIGAKPRKRTAAANATAPDPRATLATATRNATATATPAIPATLTATPTPATATPTPTPIATPSPSPTATAASSSAPEPPPFTGRSRYVSPSVWRAVWERDHGCCAWPLESGTVCGATYQLELDHINGWALGAGTTVDECRLLCRRHNLRRARAQYGDAVMDRYTRRDGGRCSEPVAEYLPAGENVPRSSSDGARSRAHSGTSRGAQGDLARRSAATESRRKPRRRRPGEAERPESRGGTPRRRRRPWARRPCIGQSCARVPTA